jgi:hypothetical protein
MATREFALDEQETTFTIEATDRSVVHVYSNDLVYQGKLERAGCMPYRDCEDGGKFYKLPVAQLRIAKPMSDERKRNLAERLRRKELA